MGWKKKLLLTVAKLLGYEIAFVYYGDDPRGAIGKVVENIKAKGPFTVIEPIIHGDEKKLLIIEIPSLRADETMPEIQVPEE